MRALRSVYYGDMSFSFGLRVARIFIDNLSVPGNWLMSWLVLNTVGI